MPYGDLVKQAVQRFETLEDMDRHECTIEEREEYEPLVRAGAEALIVYQETYDPVVYAELHTAGPKRDYAWRLACPERAYDAGFRRIGVGALFGLCDWRSEAIALMQHLEYLLKRCWKAQFTVSFPRLRPCAGEYEPRFILDDRDFSQLIFATRMCFPEVGIILSTREPQPISTPLTSMMGPRASVTGPAPGR